MSSVVPFQFESHSVRVLNHEDQPLFHARDVALALGYQNQSKAYQDHCKHLKLLSYNELLELDFSGPNPRGEYFIPESDVYRLTMRSKLDSAERFQDWVCEEVLPSIRKTGKYEAKPPKPANDVKELKAIVTTAKLMKALAATMGLRGNQAIHSANLATQRLTGVAPLKLLDAESRLADEQDILLSPTDIEQIYEWGHRQANLRLTEWGLQMAHRDHKNRLYYELTPKGQEAGGVYIETGKQHSDGSMVRAVRWNKSILDCFVRKHAH